MKILYAGSPEAARKTLEILFNNQEDCGFEIAGVLSNPPSAKGRHKELIPTPVAAFALEKNIPVFTPEHLDAAAREEISPLNCDLLVSFAYGHIFGPKFMALFPMGGINLHPSLLPKYRGCTPVPAAILNRDKQTAATIQRLAPKMDEGNILSQEVISLDLSETGEELLNKSAEIGAKLICNLLKEASQNNSLPEGKVQEGEASYTGIITKLHGKIFWNVETVLQEKSIVEQQNDSSDSIETLEKLTSGAYTEAKIRAYYPDPGCWCVENNLPLKIHQADFISFEDTEKISAIVNQMENPSIDFIKEMPNGKVFLYHKGLGILVKVCDGVLVLKKLQRQGKNPMNYKDFMNGARDFVGTVLL
ncbi:MAG: methionyl-tRNA formyltransferase [Treponema sp.]|nr:methionyl-tRNA formyltransferase [Treponema sp.]